MVGILKEVTSMTDPVTVGTIAASVFAMASEALVKGAVGEAVKDAYAMLKANVVEWAADDAEALANAPRSPGRKAVLAEAIDERSGADRAAITQLVRVLADELERAPPTGMVLRDLEDVQTRIKALVVESGTGVVVKKQRGGTIDVGEVRVGRSPGK
jgi:hypothetical protein